MLDVRYGIRTPITLLGPSARAARYAVTAESTPPDIPITAVVKWRCSISSRMNSTSHSSARRGSISRGFGGSLADGGAATTRNLPAPLSPGVGRGVDAKPRFAAVRAVPPRARRPAAALPIRGPPPSSVGPQVGPSYRTVTGIRALTASRLAARCGAITSRSATSGMSARARVTSARSAVAATTASSQSGPRTRTSPFGPTSSADPANSFPPSLPTRFESVM